MILLTQAQANQVRGLTVSGHALAPKPFVGAGASNAAFNGMLGLPEACINDPAHTAFSTFLRTLPTVPDASIVQGTTVGLTLTGSDWSVNPAYTAACTYNETWVSGQLQTVNIVPA